MIPIYPGNFTEYHIESLFKQLNARVEQLEEQDFLNRKLISLLIQGSKNTENLIDQHQINIVNLINKTNKIEKKQKQIRIRFGQHVNYYIKNIRNIRARIETIEDKIDDLNTQMSKLSIN